VCVCLNSERIKKAALQTSKSFHTTVVLPQSAVTTCPPEMGAGGGGGFGGGPGGPDGLDVQGHPGRMLVPFGSHMGTHNENGPATHGASVTELASCGSVATRHVPLPSLRSIWAAEAGRVGGSNRVHCWAAFVGSHFAELNWLLTTAAHVVLSLMKDMVNLTGLA
jgi:hypothetical protein